MKKTISDLKIGDTMFIVFSSQSCAEMEVISISKETILLESESYSGTYICNINELERTSWQVNSKQYSTEYPTFTEKIDALRNMRKKLEKELSNIFERQVDLLAVVMNKNNQIMENTKMISIELSN